MTTASADVLILGAGSAGCVLANRLSADPSRRVVVLEAGGRVTDPDMRRPELWPFIQHREYDWDYLTVPQPRLAGRQLSWARGRGLGGSSLLHANAHMRGCRADFDRWVAATGDERWSWDELLPRFKAMESFSGGADEVHGADGPLSVLLPGPDLVSPLVQDYLAGAVSLGIPRIPDHNGGEMLGATPNSLTLRNGERMTVADAYLDPVMDRPNLAVLTGVVVERLRISRGRVVGAAVIVGGERMDISADTVILSAGSIADPLLLMRSGVGDPDVLEAAGVATVVESRGVGKNLHDHLLGAGNLYRAAKPVPPTRLNLSESMCYQSAKGLGETAGPVDVVVGCVVAPSASESFEPGVGLGEGFTLLFGVTNPTSRGELRISGPSVDDAPLIDPNYLDTEHDRSMFRLALERARAIAGTEAMAGWRAEEVLPGQGVRTEAEVDAFIARAAITHHHPVGTLRMGADDEAPVTPDLAFRGIDGLHVVDASVIPSITAGPVHAPVLAIAETFTASYA
ncbi:GMC family oxidoreductase [Naasia sp. SYSU D00057]|uniref:GMC family oxidoreductase n=1 Tax=Naasia sp. SYSU D00057 TaxID=2817380 RepID=UPI001B31152D|nr:GMC family oxidoreductase N-terminal domain-containing protein [Naasia sp. SYSU D00057]